MKYPYRIHILSRKPALDSIKQIKLAIEDLDFIHGNVGFECIDTESMQRFDFEIENEEFRPEFDVLKPYFIKFLKTKMLAIDICPEIENGVILSQLATPAVIENINKKIVDSVKFQFLSKSFIGQMRHRNKVCAQPDHLN